MKAKTLYLGLCVLGVALPYSQFLPWLVTNGLNFQLFFDAMFANRISAFFVMDVLVSAVVLMSFARREQLPASARWLTLAAVLTVGVSLALPLLLYLRERKLSG